MTSITQLDRINMLPATDAERELLACCAAPAWARAVTAARPYPGLGELVAAGGAAFQRLTWADVAQAMAAHPRIGQQPSGDGREAGWSRREQSAVADADEATRAALAQANVDYELRFGHVFLICASGRGPAEILAAARQRLGHDTDTERQVVREELRKITLLRLERLLQ